MGRQHNGSKMPAYNSDVVKEAFQYFAGEFCGYINFSASYESWCWKSPPSPSCQTLWPHALRDEKPSTVSRL